MEVALPERKPSAMHEILEHAADVGFRVRAASLPELFARAAEALAAISFETDLVEPRESYAIEAEGESTESLLVNWLSEVLYYLDGRNLALRTFKVKDLTTGRLTGDALGEPRNASRHAARLVVKGITYHQLKIEPDAQGWLCEVFLDV